MSSKTKLYLKQYVLDSYTLKISSLIIVIIIFVSSVGLLSFYKISVDKIKNMSVSASKMKLDQIIKVVDININQANSMANSLSIDSDVNNLNAINYMSAKDKISRVAAMGSRLKSLKNSNYLLDSVYLYYPDTGYVIYDAIYDEADVYDVKFVQKNENYNKSLNISKSIETRFSHYTDAVMKDTFKIVKTLAIGNKRGYVVVNIDAKSMRDLIYSMQSFQNEHVFILNHENEVIMQTNNDNLYTPELLSRDITTYSNNSEKYVIVKSYSEVTEWTYISLIPLKSIYNHSQLINTFMIIIFVIMIIIGCVLGILITVKISKPINNLYYSIVNKFAGESSADHLALIAKTYDNLCVDNEKMLNERLMLNTLLNINNNETEANYNQKNSVIRFLYEDFVVAVVQLHLKLGEVGEIEYLKMNLCTKYIQQGFTNSCCSYCVQFEPNKLAVIINYDKNITSTEEIFTLSSNLVGALKGLLNTDINIGISNNKYGSKFINAAFLEALKALEYQYMTGKNEIIHFGNIDYSSVVSMCYPFNLENELIEAIRACDEDQMRKTLNEIKIQMQKSNGMPNPFNRQCFIYMINNIRQISFKLISDEQFTMLYDEKGKQLIEADNINEYISNIDKLCTQIISIMKEYKVKKNSQIVEKILEYIDENYNKNITVEQISSLFHISVSYCYRLLKDEKDISPVNYISSVRVKEALDSLKDTNRSVKEISDDCGFESVQSFYRQFKKIMGCSPSEYRKNNLGTQV